MQTFRTFPFRPCTAVLAACAGLALLGGCSNRQELRVASTATETTAPWPATAPAINVSNFNGRIDLIVDPRATSPTVAATAVAGSGETHSTDSEVIGKINVTSGLETGPDGGHVYRVVSASQDGLPSDLSVRLEIRVPSAGAINVYNRGGPVRIDGPMSAVQVENGRGVVEGDGDDGVWEVWDTESDDAWIQVRSPSAIDQPVALITDSGDVVLVLGPDARGQFDIQAPNGAANARARVGTFDRFKATGRTLSARYNQGTNAVLLRTENGDATAIMVENPSTFVWRMW